MMTGGYLYDLGILHFLNGHFSNRLIGGTDSIYKAYIYQA